VRRPMDLATSCPVYSPFPPCMTSIGVFQFPTKLIGLKLCRRRQTLCKKHRHGDVPRLTLHTETCPPKVSSHHLPCFIERQVAGQRRESATRDDKTSVTSRKSKLVRSSSTWFVRLERGMG
jgi:hypothetical protein